MRDNLLLPNKKICFLVGIGMGICIGENPSNESSHLFKVFLILGAAPWLRRRREFMSDQALTTVLGVGIGLIFSAFIKPAPFPNSNILKP